MSRFTTATSIGLAFAIALVAGIVGWRVTTFSSPLLESSSADPAVGHAFYAAINDVLAGNNENALDEIVTPGFVDRIDGASSDELTDRLTAFGQSFPGTQLQVVGMEPSANSLVVSLAPIAPAAVPFAGATLSTQPFDGGYEVLRIHNGKVAERWSAGLPALSATNFPEASFSVSASTSMAMRLDRTELPSGSELKWQPGRTAVLMVESGAVRVQLSWTQQGEALEEIVDVHAGEVLLIPSNKRVRLDRTGAETARLLVFSMCRVRPTEAPAPVHSGSATSQLLWTSNLPLAPSGEWSVAFGKVLIPERADVTLHGAGTLEVLLCTETSAMQVMAEAGVIESLAADLTKIDRANAKVLAAGSGANVQDADSIGLRTAPDAGGAVWLITISPESPLATPSL